MAHYSTAGYWDRRYEQHSETTFDWYQSYDALKQDLTALLPAGGATLVVGTGTSLLAERMHDDGFVPTTAVDFSAAAIQVMRDRSADDEQPARPELVYQTGDASAMTYLDAAFDIVVDKGMIDACFCGVDREVQQQHVAKVVQGIHRVLKPGGKFVTVTHTATTAGARAVVYDGEGTKWQGVELVKLEKPPTMHYSVPPGTVDELQYHYVFVMTK